MWAGARVGRQGVKAEWKLGRGRGSVRGRKRAQTGDHSLTILSNQESDGTLHEWQFLNSPPPTTDHPLPPSSVAMSEKTATRNPSSRGKCKEKQETVREWGPGFKQVPFFLAFFEWVLKIPSWQSAHGSWMEKDKRGGWGRGAVYCVCSLPFSPGTPVDLCSQLLNIPVTYTLVVNRNPPPTLFFMNFHQDWRSCSHPGDDSNFVFAHTSFSKLVV